MKVACVLRESHEFNASRVYALADSILDHNDVEIVCLTDARVNHPGVTVIPLQHKWPTWWPKIELFNLCRGETLYLDLDTVVVGKLPAISERFTMLEDVNKPGSFGSGVMSWKNSPLHLYQRFMQSPNAFINRYVTRDKWGDQDFIKDYLGFTPDTFGDEFRSYKKHCKNGVPAGTKVVYFHGKPRPWNVTLEFYNV